MDGPLGRAFLLDRANWRGGIRSIKELFLHLILKGFKELGKDVCLVEYPPEHLSFAKI